MASPPPSLPPSLPSCLCWSHCTVLEKWALTVFYLGVSCVSGSEKQDVFGLRKPQSWVAPARAHKWDLPMLSRYLILKIGCCSIASFRYTMSFTWEVLAVNFSVHFPSPCIILLSHEKYLSYSQTASLTYVCSLSLCQAWACWLQWSYLLQVHSYRNPVLFTDAAAQIPENAVIVEIGPHSILRSPLRQNRPELKYVGVMRKGACGVETLNSAVAEMWRSGVPVHWEASPVPQGGSGTEGNFFLWCFLFFQLYNAFRSLALGSRVYEAHKPSSI